MADVRGSLKHWEIVNLVGVHVGCIGMYGLAMMPPDACVFGPRMKTSSDKSEVTALLEVNSKRAKEGCH